MPPAITLPGSFFSSSPPPPSAAADVIRVKQARKPSSPPPPAPARQINTTQHIDVPSQPSAIFPAPARNVNAIKSSDARFISILADGHVFDIPADLVKRYCWVRERTIKSYRAVTAGTASPGDLAFIFGTLSLSHVDRAPDLGIGSEKAAQPIQKTSNEGGKVEQSRNETALEEHQREDPGARVFQEDGTQGLPYSKRAIEVIEISDEEEEDPIQHPRRRIRHLPAENGALQDDMHIVPRSGTQLIPQIPALARWDRRQWPVPIFAGDFASVHDAEMSTGMRRTWVMGKYVEGEISFEGQFAQSAGGGWGYVRCECEVWVVFEGRVYCNAEERN
ncbi:uncharacterized protein H6S33_008076 [Morchella sextelata]|uniref:uncharacterized protein n=1 Tax=Morchella sextelata TaxID=1174677 RepID=UPI001D04F2CA|nr:uncharacterized protein H6S33_008076 [Morchella sextelata]KAH0603072.1 hypothetical protein H6S33_008076 [Morchella sextelata]